MKTLPTFICVVFVGIAASLAGCKKQPPLDPQLQAVKCPAGEDAHASATFVKAKITFLCITKELAGAPHLLRCDRTSRPLVCEDAGGLYYSVGADGTVYVGPSPEMRKRFADPRADVNLTGTSYMTVNFHTGPPRTRTFDEAETPWRFLIPDGKELLPSRYKFVKGTLCDRQATVLNNGICNLEAESASLYWHIAVGINADKGTPITEEEYRRELAFWLKFLDKVVQDPAAT
jgi:hypothetical protein